MKLTVIGCSPAWPNAGGAQSGYLVEGEGRLLLDCGPGVLARLRRLDDGWPRVDAVAITHFHADKPRSRDLNLQEHSAVDGFSAAFHSPVDKINQN